MWGGRLTEPAFEVCACIKSSNVHPDLKLNCKHIIFFLISRHHISQAATAATFTHTHKHLKNMQPLSPSLLSVGNLAALLWQFIVPCSFYQVIHASEMRCHSKCALIETIKPKALELLWQAPTCINLKPQAVGFAALPPNENHLIWIVSMNFGCCPSSSLYTHCGGQKLHHLLQTSRRADV